VSIPGPSIKRQRISDSNYQATNPTPKPITVVKREKYQKIVDMGLKNPLRIIFSYLSFSDWKELIKVNKRHYFFFSSCDYKLMVKLSVEKHGCLHWKLIDKLKIGSLKKFYAPSHPNYPKMLICLGNAYHQKLHDYDANSPLCYSLKEKNLAHLRGLKDNEKSLFHHLDLSPFGPMFKIEDIRPILGKMPHLQSLKLRKVFHLTMEPEGEDSTIEREFSSLSFPNLTELDLSLCKLYQSAYRAVFTSMPRLESLSLRSFNSSDNPFSRDDFESLNTHALRRLILDFTHFDSVESFHALLQNTNLQELSLRKVSVKNSENSIALFDQLAFENLEILTYAPPPEEQPMSLTSLLRKTPHLRQLTLCSEDTFSELQLPHLSHITFTSCTLTGNLLGSALRLSTTVTHIALHKSSLKKIHDNALQNVSKQTWESLTIQECEGLFEDSFIQSLLTGATNLKELHFSHLNYKVSKTISEKAFEKVRMPKLSTISIDRCRFTEKAVFALIQKAPDIKELYLQSPITGSFTFTKGFLENLALHSLEIIDLSYCPMNESFLPTLVKKATRLIEIRLYHHNLTPKHFEGLSQNDFKGIRVVGFWKDRDEFFRKFLKTPAQNITKA
jgi:uncharacterized protein YjbI with pentapeptide repeats